MQEWTYNNKDEAFLRLKSKGFLSRAISVPIIELQCEVTALREALEVLLEEHNCDYGDVDYDGTKTECDTCTPIKELLARIPQ